MNDRDKEGYLDEFQLISDFFAPLAKNNLGALNLLDDCAIFTPKKRYDLVLTKDTIVGGVHFFETDDPSSIACKALGVNLSDIASKGAVPRVYLLSISLTDRISKEWLTGFSSGLKSMQEEYQVKLAGGDTVRTPGPLTISITMIGEVPSGMMVRRSGAKVGDLIYVSGTIGDSWAGLQLFLENGKINASSLSEKQIVFLKSRYLIPSPRTRLAEAVRSCASAAMDISDGLGGDLLKLCKASGTGAELVINKIPLSDATAKLLMDRQELMPEYINGGDDYEILATVSQSNASEFEEKAIESNVPVRNIGRITDNPDNVTFLSETGELVELKLSGYKHFK